MNTLTFPFPFPQDILAKIELPQCDGISVKEKIIRFFQRKLTREDAETVYAKAVELGEIGGTELFDESISLICTELELDENELIEDIKRNNQ